MKYNKQEVIMGEADCDYDLLVSRKMEIDLSLLIIRCDVLMCPRLFWLR